MIALALLVALAQEPAAPRPTGEDPGQGWQDADRVLLVINDDILTFVQLHKPYRRLAREENVRTPEGRRKLWAELLDNTVRMRIATQAGEALGFDKALIDHHAREDFNRTKRTRGGVVEMSKWLVEQDLTAEELKEQKRNGIYAMLWEEAVTGRGVSAAARPSRDRYVRPGLLRFKHQIALATPGALARIGGRDDEFELQHLFVDASDFDRPERARELAAQLRSRIVDGEDMSELVRKYDADTPNDGILAKFSRAALEGVFPGIETFLRNAKEGDVSDVVALDNGRRRGFVLFRLHARTAAQVPDLAEPEVQEKIRELIQKELDEQRIDAAMHKAMAGSFVWEGELPRAN